MTLQLFIDHMNQGRVVIGVPAKDRFKPQDEQMMQQPLEL